MRKFLLGLFVFVLSATSVMAQDVKKELKAAEKSMSTFSTSSDKMDLQNAADKAATVVANVDQFEDARDKAEAYITAGDIYAAVINQYVIDRVAAEGKKIPAMVPGAAVKAAKAYLMAYEVADKKGDKKDAIEGLQNLQGNLSNEGIYAIQDNEYDASYAAFKTSVDVHAFLQEQGEASTMDENEKTLQDEMYYAALSALQVQKVDEAEELLNTLYADEYDDPNVYDGLYKVAVAREDKEGAAKYLAEGRKKYPDATNLLFTEINFYLSEGKLDELTSKLEEAIEKEPENISLYATAGSVYERLHNLQKAEGNMDQANTYFDKAKGNYEKGLEIDDDDANLIYSLGALYYNRAAAMTQELVKLGDDYSKEGQKKYDALKEQVDAEFQLALPYFQKAEMADPANTNTLLALKEMYARMDEYEVSNEFKARYEKIQAGEKVDKSYFAEKGM